MDGYWKKAQLWTEKGGRAGHLNLGPLQFNWGYTPGLRIYLTWSGQTRTLLSTGRYAR
jgi:hypothetical protein